MGVIYFTVKPNEKTVFFLPTNSNVQAYISAWIDVVVAIDDMPIKMLAESYHITTDRFHRTRSNGDSLSN